MANKPKKKPNAPIKRVLLVLFGLGLGGFALLAAPTPPAPVLAPAGVSMALRLPEPPPPAIARPAVAVIIDDLGPDEAAAVRAIRLAPAITLAWLPYAPRVKALTDAAGKAGHQLIVHMPSEPKGDAANPGVHALLTGVGDERLRADIAWNLDRFSGFAGINNHMGSRFTEDPQAMRILFEEVKRRDLIFIDSRTTAHSVGAELADRMGLAYAERDIFLDNEQQALSVETQLAKLEAKAREFGSAIAIGHPHGVTLAAIDQWTRSLEAKGIDLVPASVIVERRGTPLWRMAIREQ